jgi:hypothetical protein
MGALYFEVTWLKNLGSPPNCQHHQVTAQQQWASQTGLKNFESPLAHCQHHQGTAKQEWVSQKVP